VRDTPPVAPALYCAQDLPNRPSHQLTPAALHRAVDANKPTVKLQVGRHGVCKLLMQIEVQSRHAPLLASTDVVTNNCCRVLH
jgi:hypothetical protein